MSGPPAPQDSSRDDYERRRSAKCYGIEYKKKLKDMLAEKPEPRRESWTDKGPSSDPRLGGRSC